MGVARDTVAGLAVRRNSDAQLLDHALRGDAVAFSEIHRRYSGRVFAFCLARLMSVDAAQDATQEVFLRLLSADSGQVRSISGWLFGVARHVCIDIARSRQRAMPTDSASVEAELEENASQFSAEDEALSKAEASDIFLALRRMRPRYRMVLVQKELHGQSVSEIAAALAINMGAAYTLLSRARDAFGKAYAQTRELPSQCRVAVELLYRETGSGISPAEAEKLRLHLAQCARCSREARHAKERPLFAGLLPLLPMQWGLPRGQLAKALSRLGDSVPSLTSAAPAAPSWLPAVVGATVAGALLIGAAGVPARLQSQTQAAKVEANRITAGISARTAAEDDAAYQHSESNDLWAELRLHRQMRTGREAAPSGQLGREAAGAGESAGRKVQSAQDAAKGSQVSGGSTGTAAQVNAATSARSTAPAVPKRGPTDTAGTPAGPGVPSGTSKGSVSDGAGDGSGPSGASEQGTAP
jgi:RNA polymerase sigma-70 factor, ECF subfamily